MAVFSRTATWIIMAGCILMNATFIMIVPLSLNDMPAWTLEMMSHMIGIVSIGFFCSVLGEIVANPSDRIFILTRVVRRSSYLLAKVLLALLIAGILAGANSIFYWRLDERLSVEDPGMYVVPWKLCITMFTLAILGASCGVTMRFYLREMLISVVILVVSLSYVVGFVMANATEQPPVMQANNEWQYFKVPLYIFLPLSAGVLTLGFILNSKVNIGA